MKRSIFACDFHWKRTTVKEQAEKRGLSGFREAYQGSKCSICGRPAAFEFYEKPSCPTKVNRETNPP
jgi:hypothetical protein